jgi:hypothetical protein
VTTLYTPGTLCDPHGNVVDVVKDPDGFIIALAFSPTLAQRIAHALNLTQNIEQAQALMRTVVETANS